jgi:hypothetical protein
MLESIELPYTHIYQFHVGHVGRMERDAQGRLTARVTNLDTSLADVERNNFTHSCYLEMKAGSKGDEEEFGRRRMGGGRGQSLTENEGKGQTRKVARLEF